MQNASYFMKPPGSIMSDAQADYMSCKNILFDGITQAFRDHPIREVLRWGQIMGRVNVVTDVMDARLSLTTSDLAALSAKLEAMRHACTLYGKEATLGAMGDYMGEYYAIIERNKQGAVQ